MDSESWTRVKELWSRAVELPPAERGAWLAEACGDDEALRSEISRLLESDRAAREDFLGEPAIDRLLGRRAPSGVAAGRKIGAWRITREIGHGGMGTLYLVERTEGGFRQRGALKLVRAALPGSDLADRFLHERQILAELEHAGIARLLDGGTTDDGLPYLVMEFVEGERIDHYCDRERLDLDARIDLFLRVCAAVAHAHQHLIVHRDLKPSNILVTAEGEPKLLDFGIAKLLTEHAADLTRTALPVLTPDYASPEQLHGRRASTRSDVFALGVLLYELLTGHRPHELHSRSLPLLARARQEEPPQLPSKIMRDGLPRPGEEPPREPPLDRPRAEELAALRRSTPQGLGRALHGDLDAIILKALRSEPELRYPSVEALAVDLRLERQGLPVTARPGTRRYRAAKYLRRNTAALVAGLLVAGSMTAAVVASRRQASRAEAERLKTEQVNAVLEKILWSPNSAWYAGGGAADVTMIEVLEKAADWVPEQLAETPEVEARFQYSLGTTLASVAKYPAAERALRRSVELHRQVFGDSHAETAKATAALGGQLVNGGDFTGAEAELREVLSICERARDCDEFLGHLVPGTLWGLGYALVEGGRPEEGEQMHRQALELWSGRVGQPDALTGQMLVALGRAELGQGDLEGAAAHYRQASEIPSARFTALLNLGELRNIQRRPYEAELALREAADLAKRDGDRPDLVATTARELARSQLLQGNLGEANRQIREAVESTRSALGDDHRYLARARWAFAEILLADGSPAKAEEQLSMALESRQKELVEGAWELGGLKSLLGASLWAQGRGREAEPLLREGHRVLERALGPLDPRTTAAEERLTAAGLGPEP